VPLCLVGYLAEYRKYYTVEYAETTIDVNIQLLFQALCETIQLNVQNEISVSKFNFSLNKKPAALDTSKTGPKI